MESELDTLEAVANKTRLGILLLTKGATMAVKCMAQTIELPQPTVSRHLSVLRKSGFLTKNESGVRCFYTQNEKWEYGVLRKNLVSAFQKELANKEPYVSDKKRLKKLLPVCGEGCNVSV